MEKDTSEGPRGRSRGRGRGKEEKPEETRPGITSATEKEPAVVFQGARGRARGRAIPLGSPGAAGRALLRDPQPVDPGQESLAALSRPDQASLSALSRSLASTCIDSEAKSVAATSQSAGRGEGVGRGVPRLRTEQRGTIVKTKPNSIQDKKGKTGRSVELVTNYFKMCGKPDWILMQYRVDFKPEVESTVARKGLIKSLAEKLGKFQFDGSILFTTARYRTTPLVFQVTRKNDDTVVTVTIKEVGEVHPNDYHYLQFFNIVLRECLQKLNLQMLGRNYYNPAAARILLNFKLELWPGYITSIRQHEDNVLLCCEISTKVLRQDTVLDQLTECYKKDPKNWENLFIKHVLGSTVITRYNNKTYRIDEICYDMNPSHKFKLNNGREIDYRQYYLEKYGIKINDSNQPLLVSMPKLRELRGGVAGPIFLVPELCNMTGLTDEQRANFQLMKAMADYTRQTPHNRAEALNNFSKRIHDNPEVKKVLSDWNLQFSQELEKLRGRVLPPETIYGAEGSRFGYPENNADWGRALNNWKVPSTVSVFAWAVIHTKRDEEATKTFVDLLLKSAPPVGLALNQPKLIQILDNRPHNYIQELTKVIDEGPQIVMIVVPNNKGEHYHAVKKMCCVTKPIPSQVMTGTVISKSKGLGSVASKVAIQMLCKLGGEPWNIKFPIKDTMIMGYNANPDSSKKGIEVGALVSSLNETFTKFSSTCIFNSSHEDVIKGMGPAVAKALRRYREANGKLPQRIIMYRDGLGEGQIEYARDKEIAAIKKVFKENDLEHIKFTFIIVSKRINTRFFMGSSRLDNPPSGTIVDDVVTLPERYDFFLISQSVRQGTVNPTSYNVIEDSSGLKPDHIQQLTYKLTHLYYNWSGTVRVPAPCQYAHKLAFLVGQSLHKEPSEQLEDQLFYL